MLSLLLLLGLCHCDATPQPDGRPDPETIAARGSTLRQQAPGPSDRGVCADLQHHRVCWDTACPRGICVFERPLPPARAPDGGWRCVGSFNERTCEPRTWNADRFACFEDRCVQTYPRQPDDGDWECVELSGAVLCRLGSAPAGVIPGPLDIGWRCGARPDGERLCVDLSPDVPDPTRLWECHYERGRGTRRLCDPRPPGTSGLESPCQDDAGCPARARCTEEVCVPNVSPTPNCWLEADCKDHETCHFGTCVALSDPPEGLK